MDEICINFYSPSAEVHFWRLNPAVWEKCLCRVKEAGISVVSTYLSWRRHELEPGRYDFEGIGDKSLNFLRFLELCRRCDVKVILKPGPWICAEEKNGGYPDWLLSIEEILALDAKCLPVKAYHFPFNHYIPCYLHPLYLTYAEAWLGTVAELIKSNVYPTGPIIAVQLDNEPSFGFQDDLFDADYNSVIAGRRGVYQEWLKEKYHDLNEVNKAYGSSYRCFDEIFPPRTIEPGITKNRYIDWINFKEILIKKHLEHLKGVFIQKGLNGLTFTANFNEHKELDIPNSWQHIKQVCGFSGYDIYAIPPVDIDSHVKMSLAINYCLAVYGFAWAPELMTGIWKIEGQVDYSSQITEDFFKFLYLSALASGLSGMNFYMFVDRENWCMAPIRKDGEKGDTWGIIKKIVELIKDKELNLTDYKLKNKVGILYYRTHAYDEYLARNIIKHKLENKFLPLKPLKLYKIFFECYKYLLLNSWNPKIVTADLIEKETFGPDTLVIIEPSTFDERITESIKKFKKNGGKIIELSAKLNDNIDDIGSIINNLSGSLANLNMKPDILTSVPLVYGNLFENNNMEKILYLVNLNNNPVNVTLNLLNLFSAKTFSDLLSDEIITVSHGNILVKLRGQTVRLFKIYET